MRRRLGRWAGAWSVATAAVLLVSMHYWTGTVRWCGCSGSAVQYGTAMVQLTVRHGKVYGTEQRAVHGGRYSK